MCCDAYCTLQAPSLQTPGPPPQNPRFPPPSTCGPKLATLVFTLGEQKNHLLNCHQKCFFGLGKGSPHKWLPSFKKSYNEVEYFPEMSPRVRHPYSMLTAVCDSVSIVMVQYWSALLAVQHLWSKVGYLVFTLGEPKQPNQHLNILYKIVY